MSERGYVKLHRKILSSAVFANGDLLKLFVLCLCRANHKETWVQLDGVAEPVRVQPGQFVTGRNSLHQWYYGRKKKSNKTTYTVWRWLKTLEKMQDLHINSFRDYTLVTVCNWERYQNSDGMNAPRNALPAHNGRTTDAPPACTKKNDKKDNNAKKGGERICPPSVSSAFNLDSEKPRQACGELEAVLAAWAQKLGVKGNATVSPRDRSSWTAAAGLHGKAWCLDAIGRARSIHGGVVIVEAEKRDEQRGGGNDTDMQAEIAAEMERQRASAERCGMKGVR